MNAGGILLAIVAGILAGEVSDLCPWLARRLVYAAARLQYGAKPVAQERGDEWVAYIDDRPGKLLKLIVALGFLGMAFRVPARSLAVRAPLLRSVLIRLIFAVLIGEFIPSVVGRVPVIAPVVHAPEPSIFMVYLGNSEMH